MMVAAALAATGCVASAAGQVTETRRQEVAVSGATPIAVETSGGSIDVRPGTDGVVKVEARVTARDAEAAKAIAIVARLDGGRVVVRHEPQRLRDARVDFVIDAPAAAAARLDSGGGAITVRGRRADVEAHTGGGAITVDDVHGAVRAGSGGGTIQITHADGTVNARTGGGTISVAGKLRGECRLESGGGTVTARIPATSRLRVEGATDGGSARSDFALDTKTNRSFQSQLPRHDRLRRRWQPHAAGRRRQRRPRAR